MEAQKINTTTAQAVNGGAKRRASGRRASGAKKGSKQYKKLSGGAAYNPIDFSKVNKEDRVKDKPTYFSNDPITRAALMQYNGAFYPPLTVDQLAANSRAKDGVVTLSSQVGVRGAQKLADGTTLAPQAYIFAGKVADVTDFVVWRLVEVLKARGTLGEDFAV